METLFHFSSSKHFYKNRKGEEVKSSFRLHGESVKEMDNGALSVRPPAKIVHYCPRLPNGKYHCKDLDDTKAKYFMANANFHIGYGHKSPSMSRFTYTEEESARVIFMMAQHGMVGVIIEDYRLEGYVPSLLDLGASVNELQQIHAAKKSLTSAEPDVETGVRHAHAITFTGPRLNHLPILTHPLAILSPIPITFVIRPDIRRDTGTQTHRGRHT